MRERNKRRIGAEAEQQIRKYLSEHGYTILEMNYRCRQGEVDIIASGCKFPVCNSYGEFGIDPMWGSWTHDQ